MNDCMIETINLTKRYGDQTSVSALNLHVQRGRIYGLLGRNGAGKTTTMRMLLGLTQPSAGDIRLFGERLAGHERALLPRIGCMIESPGFYPNLTGTENLQIFARLRGVRRGAIQDALSVVGLPYRDKKLFAQYSLGMKQRLAIALAVMHEPDMLILDEPVNGLDPIGIAEMRTFLRRLCDERKKTILISSHILSEMALLADDIGILDRGMLLEEGNLAELEARADTYLRLAVSDAAQSAQIISEVFRKPKMTLQDSGTLLLHDTSVSAAEIIRTLVQNGVDVYDAHKREDSLEDYFRRVTGGEGIG